MELLYEHIQVMSQKYKSQTHLNHNVVTGELNIFFRVSELRVRI